MPVCLAILQWSRDLSAAEGGSRSPHTLLYHPLQWSRDLSAAEGPAPNRTHHAPDPPSMEPRPLGRGRCRATCHDARISRPLQWSRDLSAAEGPSKRTIRWPWPAFNGAATSRPRKGAAMRGAPPKKKRPSMEPRPLGRGRQPSVDQQRDPAPPSMEPRPLGRGRIFRIINPRSMLYLQWSRDLSAADGVFLSGHLHQKQYLQWSRDLSAAEGNNPIT